MGVEIRICGREATLLISLEGFDSEYVKMTSGKNSLEIEIVLKPQLWNLLIFLAPRTAKIQGVRPIKKSKKLSNEILFSFYLVFLQKLLEI